MKHFSDEGCNYTEENIGWDSKPIGGISHEEEEPERPKMFSQGNQYTEEQTGCDSKPIGGFSDE
jgi:hypothetical protein